MRWTITDRSTGLDVALSTTFNDRKSHESVKTAIKQLSRLGMRGGCLAELK